MAFVATVYGVGVANLLFLPLAGKIKMKLQIEKDRRALIIEAVLGIQEGQSTGVLTERILAYGGIIAGRDAH